MWNRESAVKTDETKEPPAHPSPALPADERRVVAWIGQSVLFAGTLVSSEDMTIDGRVEGTVEVRDHALTVGPHAEIRADVVAKVVTIHGAVAGNVRAAFKVEIRETGRVQGNVTAPRVVMADGALVQGDISTSNVSTSNASTSNVSTSNVSTSNVSASNVSASNVSTPNVSATAPAQAAPSTQAAPSR